MANTKGPGKGGRLGNIFTIGNLTKLPATLGTIRSFVDAVNWKNVEQEIQAELKRKIVITGLPNTGKSTLFNKIQGKYRSVVSDAPGTTRSLIEGMFGPFTLIDTPGHLPEVQESTAKDAAVILLLVDATRPLNNADRQLFDRLKQAQRPIILAMNKADLVQGDPETAAAKFAAQLGVKEIIPISAITGLNLAADLIPALIEASPEAALAIGRELPIFRRTAADRLIRNAALIGLATGLEPIPLIDIPLLLGNQVRLVLRIAAIYGEPLSSQNVRELIGAVAGGLAFRYLASEAAKAVPVGGDFVSGAIAGAGTWAIGRVALEYFAGGKQLNPDQMREMFNQFYKTMRTQQRNGTAPKELEPPQS